MESPEQAFDKIYKELTSDDSDGRAEFLAEFGSQVKQFPSRLADCYLAWRKLDAMIAEDEKRGYVAALAYTAMTLHIVSLKELISGNIIAAGNLSRQVL